MNDPFPHSLDLIMSFAGAVGFGVLAYCQRRNNPSSKKRILGAAICLIFFISAVLGVFGVNFL